MTITLRETQGISLARCLAICSVIFIHAVGLEIGRFGVQLFFMISGFLLASSIKNASWPIFLFHRFMRLFPLYTLFLGFYLVENSINFHPSQIFLLGNIWSSYPQIAGGWSISNEWIYCLLFSIFGLNSRKSVFYLLAISATFQLIAFVIQILKGIYSYEDLVRDNFLNFLCVTNPLINISFFLIGVALRHGYFPSLNIAIMLSGILMGIVIELMGIHCLFIWNFALFSILSLFFKAKIPKGCSLIVEKIGKSTYGIFFCHFIILEELNSHWKIQPGERSLVEHLFFFLISVLISGFIGILLYRFIERPLIRFSRMIQVNFLCNDSKI